MIEWKIKYGDQELPISAHDVVDSLGRALGLMYYKLENDDKIKGHVQMKIIHEMDIQIVELVKSQYAGAIEEDRKRHVRLRVVKKNPDRKSRSAATIQGKPGDIVDLTPPRDPEPTEEPERKVIL